MGGVCLLVHDAGVLLHSGVDHVPEEDFRQGVAQLCCADHCGRPLFLFGKSLSQRPYGALVFGAWLTQHFMLG